MAAMQPLPAAVTACLYSVSCTSPQAKTPSTLVRVPSVTMYPASSSSIWPANSPVLGSWPIATNIAAAGMSSSSPVTVSRTRTASTLSVPTTSSTAAFQRT